jgi:hypothetical protein
VLVLLQALLYFGFPEDGAGAETCRNFTIRMILIILRVSVVYCNYLYIVNLLQGSCIKLKSTQVR